MKANELLTKAGLPTVALPEGAAKPAENAGKTKRERPETPPLGEGEDKNVVILNGDNFDKFVIDNGGAWLIEFYAPWCGHCKALEPEWNKAADFFYAKKGMMNFAKVDMTLDENKKLKERFGISGFPTILVWEMGR